MPRKTMGTLTSNNLDSVHTSIFPIVLCKSCAVATLEHRDPSQLENDLRILAFVPDLRSLLLTIIEFLYHNTTTKLALLLELIRS